MSTELLGLVWPLKLPAPQKVVLLAIADRVSRDQRGAFPSIATLADDSCLAERTVRQALRGLEAAGLIATRLRTGTSSYYVPNVDRLEDLQAERLEARRLLRASAQTSNEGRQELPGGAAGAAGGGRQELPGGAAGAAGGGRQELPGGAAPHAGGGGSSCPLTNTNTNTNTPHTPQAALEGLAGVPSEISPDTPAPAPKATRRGRGGAAQAVELKTFLEACKQRGEDAIPEGDPVFGYADAVGIGRDLVWLAWREFKRRHLRGGKRQKNWRQTFDNSVRGAWYGFWWMAPGEPAKLTSKGEAARRAFEAEDAAALAAQGASAEQGAEVAA